MITWLLQKTLLIKNMKLIKVCPNEHGAYFLYSIPVKRGIRGKTKSVVEELLIVGVPLSKLDEACAKEGVLIIDKKKNKIYGDKYNIWRLKNE